MTGAETAGPDRVLDAAIELASRPGPQAEVVTVFDEPTFTASHIVIDPPSGACAVIDPVLGFDLFSGRTDTHSADRILAELRSRDLKLTWILETHVHADHLSAAGYLQGVCGGTIAIGRRVDTVQETFAPLFGYGPSFPRNGSQFDVLLEDGEEFDIGRLRALALHVPGHTPADLAYLVGSQVFVGDTLFMPDCGTARADFPGGDARRLYRSIRRLLALPPEARLHLCHDYKCALREVFEWTTTVADQRAGNIHIHDGVDEEAFVTLRTERDRTLDVPRLILPSLQVNIRGGRLPPAGEDGRYRLVLPLDAL